ncbi:MAG: amidohydrolase family protein [Halanaerobiales bacterium]
MEKKYDAHVHLTPPEIIDNVEEYRQKDSYFDLLSGNQKNDFATVQDLIKYLNENDIDKAVVFGFCFKEQYLCKRVNNYIISSVQKYPKRLVGFACINPKAEGVISELKRCKSAGLKGVGELFPAGQDFDITKKAELEQVVNFCSEHNWPLLVHLNEPVGHDYPGKTKDSIRRGEILAENFPNTTFIYAHLGGGLLFYELMPEMAEKLENVYYDTAAVPFLYSEKIYDSIQAAGLAGKVIFGSDYPLLGYSKYKEQFDKSDINSENLSKIIGGNIEKLL